LNTLNPKKSAKEWAVIKCSFSKAERIRSFVELPRKPTLQCWCTRTRPWFFGSQTFFVNQRSLVSMDTTTGYKPTPLWIF